MIFGITQKYELRIYFKHSYRIKFQVGTTLKGSNSSGFHPILQKFYEMICEIIVFKTVGRIFLIFCRSSFINNFIEKSNFSER